MGNIAYAGEFDDTKVYTKQRVMMILGCSPEWVERHLVCSDDGLPFRKVGSEYFFSGALLRAWVERGSAFHGKHATRENEKRRPK